MTDEKNKDLVTLKKWHLKESRHCDVKITSNGDIVIMGERDRSSQISVDVTYPEITKNKEFIRSNKIQGINILKLSIFIHRNC
jgi:hypothetical protein